ncbi:hypothetical protein ACIQ6Y_10325 [Streptomyces sp. NPDC096205]|uniref:hypothetical protein n=1 Tax=Streptomyces sp. NPDC096205 TaxID=3366081 RepID=UPI00381F3CFA
MTMRTTWRVGRLWVPAATAVVMAAAAGLTGAAPAAAQTVVNCNGNPAALQPAITAASPGDTLRVRGTCVGNFTIHKDLTLIGLGNAVLDGNGTGTTVTVGFSQVQLTNLTITGGNDTYGGGIFNHSGSTLTLDRSTVRNNSSIFYAGGIGNSATLTLRNSAVRDNVAAHGAGGIDSVGSTLTLDRSSVTHNTANGDVGGGIRHQNGTLTLTRSTVSNNSSPTNGGGIYNIGGNGYGTMTLDRSTVRENTAANRGGGIYNEGGTATLRNSTVERNTANGGPGSGGGLYNDGGTATLTNTMVRNNIPDNCAPPGTIPGCTA